MFSQIRSVHFVGIGGTAMAAAAVAMQQKGVAVTGSDQNVLSAHVDIPGRPRDRGNVRLR